MSSWSSITAFRLFIPFALGIILEYYLPCNGFFLTLSLSFSTLLLIIYQLFRKKLSSFRSRWISGVLVNFIFVVCGASIAWQSQSIHQESFYKNHLHSKNAFAKVYINNKPIVGEKTVKTKAIVNQIIEENQQQETSGEVILYFQKDTLSERIKYGDELLIRSNFQDIQKPLNPCEFDYKGYLARNNIYQSAYQANNNWTPTGLSHPNAIYQFAYSLQDKMLNTLKSHGLKGKEFGLAAALLIGEKNDLDPETITEFQNTGTMHVLAVSGMHVGLIYLVLCFLLKFFDRFKGGVTIKLILILNILLLYALLTGLSASVLRATAMFALIIIGKLLNRNSNIYNSLAVSALILCIYQPFILFDAGFQLSYFAILGILFLEPYFRIRSFSSRKITREGWGLVSVSVAAQGGTSPISLFYFNQFPNYFLLSNILIIPISTLIIYILLILLMFSPIPLIANFIGIVATWLIQLMINLNKSIGELPYSVINNIFVYPWQALSLFLSISCFAALLHYKKWSFANLSLVFAIIFVIGFPIHAYQTSNTQKLYIYNINKGSAISLVSKKNHILLGDSSTLNNYSRINFHLKKHFINENICDYHPLQIENIPLMQNLKIAENIWIHKNNIIWNNKSILVVNQEIIFPKAKLTKKIPIDLMLVCENKKMDLKKLNSSYSIKQIVVDGSNSRRTIQFYKDQSQKTKIPIRVTGEEGWFEL